ncbi:MAG: hypothetical protein HYS81_02635 [Candidatus Aenigmatarchaeota archaeon]|nr:MAG: hypothetical protein HYS81_02635 [Candidatus Aenigmarchaeota archaeon]
MPEFKSPYTRGYHHTKSRGAESNVICSFCGRTVPRYKTITQSRGFRLNDPAIMQAMDDRRFIHTFARKEYACPSCARGMKIVKKRDYGNQRR